MISIGNTNDLAKLRRESEFGRAGEANAMLSCYVRFDASPVRSPTEATAVDLAEELGRARRIFLALNDPSDLRILETLYRRTRSTAAHRRATQLLRLLRPHSAGPDPPNDTIFALHGQRRVLDSRGAARHPDRPGRLLDRPRARRSARTRRPTATPITPAAAMARTIATPETLAIMALRYETRGGRLAGRLHGETLRSARAASMRRSCRPAMSWARRRSCWSMPASG